MIWRVECLQCGRVTTRGPGERWICRKGDTHSPVRVTRAR